MLEKIVWKGSTLLGPVPPALVSCGTVEHPNALAVAWTGIVNSQPPKTYISLRPQRYSYELIRQSGEFVINLPTEKLVRAIDWCGVKSGRDVEKFAAMHLTAGAIDGFSCPLVEQAPLALACRVTNEIPLGSHHMFLADIAAVLVDSALVDNRGKLHLEKAGLCAYAHGEYFSLGKKIGSFGFSVRKRKGAQGKNMRETGKMEAQDKRRTP